MQTYDYSKLAFQKRVIDEIELEKGMHTFTVKAVDGDYTAVEYNIIRTHPNSPHIPMIFPRCIIIIIILIGRLKIMPIMQMLGIAVSWNSEIGHLLITL